MRLMMMLMMWCMINLLCELWQEPAPVLPRMELPPHNGFGSEEDSLQNCISLIPKAPYKDFNKMLDMDGKVFLASTNNTPQNSADS